MDAKMIPMVAAIYAEFGHKAFIADDLQAAIEKSESLAKPCRDYFREVLAPHFKIGENDPPSAYLSELEVMAQYAAGFVGDGVIADRLACHTSGDVLPALFHVIDPRHPELYENLLSLGAVSPEALEEVCRHSGASWAQAFLRHNPGNVQAVQAWSEFQERLFAAQADRPSRDDLARASARIEDLENRLYWETRGRREAERKREASE